MNSRAIQLSKIHALNWYGYRDSLPVKGNLVLAGVTGSGKSVLMDLLMLVLVGPEKARHHFNRSATGSRSDRTIKGYCLQDTKREENGQPQYFHDKGVTTYIAAEFTWPAKDRVETWGLRFEFNNVSETDGHCIPFFCRAPLEREDFLSISPEDGKSRPKSKAEFKALIDSKEGRVFNSTGEYLRDMANPAHLNFHQDVLHRLLPSAMSFTNLKSFDDFCRQFVLPGEAVAVDDVISSFRDYESYERELRELRAQLDMLLKIRALSKTLKDAARNRDVAYYLASEFSWKHAAKEVANVEDRLEKLKEENRGDEARLTELSELTKEAAERRENLVALLNESPDGRLYKKLVDDIGKLDLEIERLRNAAVKIDSGIGKRLKTARSWVADVAKLPLDPFIDTTRMASALEFLGSCERNETGNSLSLLADAANDLCKMVRLRFSKDAEELRRLRSEKTELDEQIDLLRRGVSPQSQPLLAALKSGLPILPGETPPRALREICEVNDESWRAAVEVAFEEKFAVLVSSRHHQLALEILHGLPVSDLVKAGAQRLIDAGAVTAMNPMRLKGSLAEILRTADPAAQACIDMLFGQMIRVSSPEELALHPSAIGVGGLIKRGGIVIRPAPYNGMPFIGEEGLKRQLEIKRGRLGEIDASLRQLEPIEQEIARLVAARQQEIPDHEDLKKQLWEVDALPKMQSNHESQMKQLEAISTEEFDRLDEEIEALKRQEKGWEAEKMSIFRKGGINEIKRAEKDLEGLRETSSRREDDFFKVKARIDIMPHHDHYRSWKSEMEEAFPFPGVVAKKFSDAASEAEKLAIATTGDLKVAMLAFKNAFHPKFDDLPEDGAETSPYERILGVIDGANIPDYEKKSAIERKRWEALFRTQVLSRMQQAIKNVENVISLLNLQLKQPIGHDRYKIEKRPNPEFRIYRELIDLNAMHHEDELFFSSMAGELKDALENFLGTLVKNANSPDAARLLDYRQYFDYKLLVTDIRDPDGNQIDVDKQMGKMSGGENQSPYFVAILASYLHAYNRHESRRKEPSLALVPIDEAFSKLSPERIQDCVRAMTNLGLQGVLSMSAGNIPYAFSQCDELIVISRKEERRGSRVGVRNVPAVLYRDTPEGRRWIDDNAS